MKKPAALILVGLIACAALLYFAPSALLAVGQMTERQWAGLTEKTLRVGDLDFSYNEGGPSQAPALLLIHGFGADKSHWSRFAKHLTDNYRVIAVDLPGFGQSSVPDGSFDVGSQTERLIAFIDALELEKIHVVGNSMGGHIAALMAARHPDRVLSAALMDNAGVNAPRQSQLFARIEGNQDNPLIIERAEDYPELLKFVFVEQPLLTEPLKHHLGQLASARSAHLKRVFAHLRERYVPLEPELPKIKAPVLMLWGDQDQVLDISSTEVMKPLLERSETVILKNCGHLPMLERPSESAGYYQNFLTRYQF